MSPPLDQENYPYQPREAFIPFHNRTHRDALLVCHRRSGKTVALVNDLVIGAVETTSHRPQFAYIAPTYVQAKRIAWQYLQDYSRPLLWPGTKPNESELRVDLVSASQTPARIFLAGADNHDSLRGIYLDGAVVDEDALINPAVTTQILLPALSDRQGWLVRAGTPKGRNHFYDTYRRMEVLAGRTPPEAFMMFLKASESGILPASELAELKARMSPDEFEQEMECSFTATAKGLILFRLLIHLRTAVQPPRIGAEFWKPFPESHSEVIASGDIGYRDQAAFWFWQCGPGPHDLRLIDYVEHAGLDAQDWIQVLRDRPLKPSSIYLPPDARAKTFTTKHSAHEQFLRAIHLGAFGPTARVNITPRTSIPDRINAARTVLPYCTFCTPLTDLGVSRLENWSFDFNDETMEFSSAPKHDVNSHGGDAFSYGAQILAYHGPRDPAPPPNPEITDQGVNYAFNLDQLFEDNAHGRI